MEAKKMEVKLIVEEEKYTENVGTDDEATRTRIKVKKALALIGSGDVEEIVLPSVGDEVAGISYLSGVFWLQHTLQDGWSEIPKSEGAIKVRGEIRDGKIIGIQEMALGKRPIPVSGDIVKGCIEEATKDKARVLPEGECVLNLRLITLGVWVIAREVEREPGGARKRRRPYRRK